MQLSSRLDPTQIAYLNLPKKPCWDLEPKGLPALPFALFKFRRTHVVLIFYWLWEY